MIQVGEKIMVVVQDPYGRGVVPATVLRFGTADPSGYPTRFAARSHSEQTLYMDDDEEGVTWCRNDPEAVAALEAAQALGVTESDEPNGWFTDNHQSFAQDFKAEIVVIRGDLGTYTLQPNGRSQ